MPATSAAIKADAGTGNLLSQLQERLVYLERRIAQQDQIIARQKEDPGAPVQVKPLAPKGPTMADLHRQAQSLHAAVAEREKQLQEQGHLIARIRQEREQVVLTFQQLRKQAEALQRVHREKLQELQQTQAERDALARQSEEMKEQLGQVRRRVDELEQELEWTRGQIPAESAVDEALADSLAPEPEADGSWCIEEDAEVPAAAEQNADLPRPLITSDAEAGPRRSRWLAALIILAGLILAGVNLANWIVPEKTYVIGGVTAEEEVPLDEWARAAPPAWRATAGPAGRLTLFTLTEDPEQARRELEDWLEARVQQITPSEAPADREPQTRSADREVHLRAEQGREELQAEIGSLESRLASLGTLRRRRIESQSELQRLRAQLSALVEPEDVKSAEIVVPREAVREAERRNERLQADLTAWNRQSRRLKEESLAALETHQEVMESLVHTASRSEAALKELLGSDVADVAREEVETLHATVRAWDTAINVFHESCSTTQSRLAEVELEKILTVLDADWFETLATFEMMGRDNAAELAGIIEEIGRSGEEPTRRLVLRNRLSQELKPLLEAWTAASPGVRELMPTHNRVLAALLASVRNVQPRIADRRKEIAAELRHRELDRQRLEVHRQRTGIEKKRTDLLEEERRLLNELNDLGEQLTEAYLGLRDVTGKLRHAGRRLFDDLQSMPTTSVAETPDELVQATRMPDVRLHHIRFSTVGPQQARPPWSRVLSGINLVGSMMILLMLILLFGLGQKIGTDNRT